MEQKSTLFNQENSNNLALLGQVVLAASCILFSCSRIFAEMRTSNAYTVFSFVVDKYLSIKDMLN